MNKKRLTVVILVIVFIIAGMFIFKNGIKTEAKKVLYEIIEVQTGSIRAMVAANGSVGPQNRVAVIPPIGGRLDELLVKEGDYVTKGQTIGWISSTERAALLDAARAEDEAQHKYWETVYKPAALVAPIDGEVIVRGVEPGQTVSASTGIVVLSNRLIVKAQVDETDVGKIKVGQKAVISLDAYPEVKAHGEVSAISYESKLVNNVVVYEVKIAMKEIPEMFRSGMSAEINIVYDERRDAALIPIDAIEQIDGKAYVHVPDNSLPNGRKQEIKLGMTDEFNSEILEGLVVGDKVLIKAEHYSLSALRKKAKNPFQMSYGKAGSSSSRKGTKPGK
ncbi:MAG: HlyD family efflux transporter periplasmic adaptor subunit [Lentisphaerae bacterium]|nr:HlyD family efflux transporter periplasmic adaptor subunit [Lentisphaerota bacterium]